MKLGLDLSNYDWPIDAACLKANGVERVVVGCQRPEIATQLVTACRLAGIEVEDVYTYVYWGFDVLAEIHKVIEVAQEHHIRRVWIDCERDGEAPGCTPESRVAQLRQCIIELEAGGFEVGIYTGSWFWVSYMGNTTEFARLPLWHAAYRDDRGYIEAVDYGGWTKLAIHQYASSPELCGRNRDYDVFWEDDMPLTQEELDKMVEESLGKLLPAFLRAAFEEVPGKFSDRADLGMKFPYKPWAKDLAGGLADHTHIPGGVKK